eukprot:5841137-Lingulodinium_polyedra.AAC.1
MCDVLSASNVWGHLEPCGLCTAPCTALASECHRHCPVTLHIAPVACGPPRPTRTCGHGPCSRGS